MAEGSLHLLHLGLGRFHPRLSGGGLRQDYGLDSSRLQFGEHRVLKEYVSLKSVVCLRDWCLHSLAALHNLDLWNNLP